MEHIWLQPIDQYSNHTSDRIQVQATFMRRFYSQFWLQCRRIHSLRPHQCNHAESLMKKQIGATMVEFALVLIVFLTFLLGILDFSRMLWTWNAANEATRWGARTAVVCNQGAAAVLKNMKVFLPQIQAENLNISWYDTNGDVNPSCSSTNNCAGVSIELTGVNYQWISPIGFGVYGLIPMPNFFTYLPREAMGQDPNSANICS